jgi:hypothetical protein
MRDMRQVVGSHDVLIVTIDTLRYDVAAELAAAGLTPNLSQVLPDGRWERRHTPASFTYAAHHAFFAGYLPTPISAGPHPRLFAARFPGSETIAEGTWVFDAPDLITGLAKVGYHTACVGGVGFFNLLSPLGSVLPSLFAESHWNPDFGVTNPDSLTAQLDRVAAVVEAAPAERPLMLFLNISAVHQPTFHYVEGANEDSWSSHAAALEYVDRHMARLFTLATSRKRPCFAIVCSDHGTAYGEDGMVGHRVAHETVWTVPYAEFVVPPAWTAVDEAPR